MQRRIFFILLSLTLALGFTGQIIARAALFSAMGPGQAESKISPELLAELAGEASARLIVDLAPTAELNNLKASARPDRQAAVLAALQETAAASQQDTLSSLTALEKTGDVTAVRPLWIVNSIAATGNLTAAQALAALPQVSQVRLDAIVEEIWPPATPTATLLAPAAAVVTGAVASWGIERVKASYAWHGLGIDGSGVTVAIMDTGVDWQHPDLTDNYRGNLGGGPVDHSGSWFNAVVPTATVPTDEIGHGTHVAGTAVGHNGLGVAPGVSWIAVNIADPLGFIYESDVHRGFEWLLAPNGDPSLAPDIVNNSWGSASANRLFVEDIAALQSSGIAVVFSAGNGGPFTGTIGYPAGYPDVLSVGASDDLDEVAWFSSRGPSAQTEEVKPWLVAPGTQIVSSLPGGDYGRQNGTSMAAPHVAGTLALLLQANPNLTHGELNQILAETAVPLASAVPNSDSGWGRLDAYAAVAGQVAVGWLSGQVSAAGLPLPNAVLTVTTPTGGQLAFTTDENGRFTAALQPGSYVITSEPFGYAQYMVADLVVFAGQSTEHHFTLTPLPLGRVEGTVRAASSYTALAGARVQVANTPVDIFSDASGRFNLSLPEGTYQLVVTKTGYQRQQAAVLIIENTAVVQFFFLADAPAILVVDSGQWYYSSQVASYAEALTNLNYSFDTWTVRNPFTDAPSLDDLSGYDTVFWSSPLDSPGLLNANDVITDYLDLGGNLFISGQNVGSYDGVGLDTQIWWYRDLQAVYLDKTAVSDTISGSSNTLFAGLTFSLNGGTSSSNQIAPDVSAPRPGSFTEPAFAYSDGRSAGLTAGYCRPFRLVYLGFGLEGVPQAGDRAAILDRSFAYFDQPRITAGVQFFPEEIDELAIPGEQMVYTITVFNRSETLTDTFQLATVGSHWTANLVTQTLTLGPCQAGQTVMNLDVPAELPPDLMDTLAVTAVSGNNPSATGQLPVRHKAPGRILFVDDDRWYDQSTEITDALDSLGLSYDRWDTGHADVQRNGPPLRLLRQYDFVIWYTGYDWFLPVTAAENLALEGYLAQGGRLFLTSQDFLYYHHRTPLARHYLGVADYLEMVEPNRLLAGGHTALEAEAALPIPLAFAPYQNHGDGIIPAAHTQPFYWTDRALPAGTATAGEGWRAVFWAIPFETITPTRQAEVMNRIMGWLSDLGDSSFQVDRRVGPAGETRTYTITLRQVEGNLGNTVWLTNTLPVGLALNRRSVTGNATYNPITRQLTWSGPLPAGGSHTISYQAQTRALLPPGFRLDNEVTLHDGNHHFAFTRKATTWVDAPDLAATIRADANRPLTPDIITATIGLKNEGLAAARQISSVISLPNTFFILTDTLASTRGEASVGDRRLYWIGDLRPGQSVTMTVVLTRAITAVPQWVAFTTLVDDGVTHPVLSSQWKLLPVYTRFFPILLHTGDP